MMKASVSKTVHVDKRPSFAGNLVTIFAGRAERTAESTALRQNLPGKSHVGRILLNDNTSQERLLDMRLSDIHNARKKTATFITHQKKTFINRMEHRQTTWVREHSRRANSLNSLARKKGEPGSQDIDEEIEESNLVYEKGESKNVGLPETKVKHSEDRTDSFPGIPARVRAVVKDKNRFASGSRVGEGRPGNISLPSLQKPKTLEKPTTSAEGIRFPSILIASEADADLANQEVLVTDEAANVNKRKPHRAETVPFREVHLTGPSPTFISEALPRIQIRECPRLPAPHGRKMRGHHRRRKRSSATRGCDSDPLEDDRFLRLQHTLAPHLAWQESRNMASIAGGVLASKKVVSEKRLRKSSQFYAVPE